MGASWHVFRHHRSLFLRVPSLLVDSASRMLTLVSLIVFGLLLFNEQIARWVQAIVRPSGETAGLSGGLTGWPHISRWWGLVPVGALVAWGLMKANYGKFQELEQAHAKDVEKIVELEGLLTPRLEVTFDRPVRHVGRSLGGSFVLGSGTGDSRWMMFTSISSR